MIGPCFRTLAVILVCFLFFFHRKLNLGKSFVFVRLTIDVIVTLVIHAHQSQVEIANSLKGQKVSK